MASFAIQKTMTVILTIIVIMITLLNVMATTILIVKTALKVIIMVAVIAPLTVILTIIVLNSDNIFELNGNKMTKLYGNTDDSDSTIDHDFNNNCVRRRRTLCNRDVTTGCYAFLN